MSLLRMALTGAAGQSQFLGSSIEVLNQTPKGGLRSHFDRAVNLVFLRYAYAMAHQLGHALVGHYLTKNLYHVSIRDKGIGGFDVKQSDNTDYSLWKFTIIRACGPLGSLLVSGIILVAAAALKRYTSWTVVGVLAAHAVLNTIHELYLVFHPRSCLGAFVRVYPLAGSTAILMVISEVALTGLAAYRMLGR